MLSLNEKEIDLIFGGSIVGDGGACLAGGAVATIGLGNC